MRTIFACLVVLLGLLSGCNSNAVTREDVEAVATRALQDSVRLQVGTGDSSFWKAGNVAVHDSQRLKFDGSGRVRLPVSLTVKGSTFGYKYDRSHGNVGNVTYATIDHDVTVDIVKNTLMEVEYRIVEDRSKVVSTTQFTCRGDGQNLVKGVITKIDPRTCSLTLSTNSGLYTATIPEEKIASLLADKFQPGLAVSLFVDQQGQQKRALYVEPQ